MALTSTEENQLRELLRRMNATQAGVTADQLTWSVNSATHFLTGNGSATYRTTRAGVSEILSGTAISPSAANAASASTSYNHLITRDAARSEINRLTDSRISTAQLTANSAAVSAAQALAKASSNEAWRSQVTPLIQRSFKVFGSVFSGNPAIEAGALNPSSMGDAARTHWFKTPMHPHTGVFFSIGGDHNYPRFNMIISNNKAVGFVTVHMPPPGLWVAIGEAA